MTLVKVNYFTDPICPWSWALEPALRRLLEEFAGNLQITYVMCGMVPEWEEGAEGTLSKLLPSTLEAQWCSGMPTDARGWLEDPPRTSSLACVAVKAAAAQGDPTRYLRRLREGFLCRRQRLDTAEALIAQARLVPALDPERFARDLHSATTVAAFEADLKLAQSAADRAGEGTPADRPELPSLEFQGAGGNMCGVYGFATYEELHRAACEVTDKPAGGDPPSIEEALGRHGSLTSAEVAAVCRLAHPTACAELWRLALDSRVSADRLLGGELWTLSSA